MNEIIEADFFLPAVETIKDASILDNVNAPHSVEPPPTKASGSSNLEVSDTKASSSRADS
jgi:hypothetical protein